jgi:hypothetical protein
MLRKKRFIAEITVRRNVLRECRPCTSKRYAGTFTVTYVLSIG